MKITLLTGKTFNFAQALGFGIKVTRSSLARKLTLRIDAKERIPALTIPKYCTNKKVSAKYRLCAVLRMVRLSPFLAKNTKSATNRMPAVENIQNQEYYMYPEKKNFYIAE